MGSFFRTLIALSGADAFDEFKLNRAEVGWYQVRNALARRNSSGDTRPMDFKPFEATYQTPADKRHPQVFSQGFLR